MLNLGKHYVSDFVGKTGDQEKYSLDLVLDEDIGAVRLTEVPPSSQMWGKYWYRSGTNHSMKKELRSIVSEIEDRFKLQEGDLWLDIACNDGTLLSNLKYGVCRLGIDPADDSYLKESSKVAEVIQDYFSLESFNRSSFSGRKAKVITTIAMFYDLQDPNPFLDDINKVLDDNGVWVMQVSYTPLMIHQMAFDNICHEHYYYYSLSSLKKLFEKHDLEIVDAGLNDANGGSIRVYIQKKSRTKETLGCQPLRDVCKFRIDSLLEFENNVVDISNPKVWEEFAQRIQSLKDEVVSFILQEKEKGKTICGYGASTKGNTLLQVFGIDRTMIDCIAERSPYKFGLKTIGTEIPIVSEAEMRGMRPDYLLVLPWHFIDEFKEREVEFLKSGGKFIIPCPKFEVIGYGD